MVLIRQIEASRGIDVGSAPNIQVDNSVAEGIQSVAQGLGSVAQNARNHELRLAERDARMVEFQADQSFTRLGTQFAADYADRQVNIDPTGKGFAEGVNTDFNTAYDDFLGTVPAPLRPKFEELALTEREKWITSAAAVESDQRNKYVVAGITDTVSSKQTEVFNNPGGYAPALADITRLIDTAPEMTPVQRAEAKKAAAQSLSQSWAERMQQDDPAALISATGLSSDKRIPIQAHDGVQMGEVAPALKDRMEVLQGAFGAVLPVISGFRDPAHNAAVGGADHSQHTHGNAVDVDLKGMSTDERKRLILTASQLGITGIGVYDNSMHFDLGGRRAWGPDYHKGSVPTWARDSIAAHMASSAQAPDAPQVAPELASLDFASRLKVYDQAQAQVQTNVTQASAATKAQYDAAKGGLELGIVTGAVASEQSILEAGLSDSDTAGLIRSFRTAQGEKQTLLQAVSQFQQGSLAVDPYSTDDRKVVDGIFDTINKAATPEQQPFAVNELIRQAGVVPTTMQNEMRVGVSSADPGVMLPALKQAQAIDDLGGGILARRDGGADIQSKADLFNVYTRNMGYSPEQAAQRIAATNDPEQVRAREALLKSKPVVDMLKAVTPNDVAGIFGWNTAVGENPGQSAAMVSEYKSMLEESLVDANGDQSAAKDLAATKFQRVYGKSDLTLAGGGVVTRLPPEKTYPPLPDGSFGYLNTQLRDALKGEGVEFDDVRLAAYDETSNDFDHGQPARYQVTYLKDGQWQMFNLPFVADYQAAIAGFNGDRTKLVEDARRRQEQNAGAVIENPQGQPANGQEMTNMLMQQLYGGANAVSP
jgi:uncharacterized protein YcbK (DUF882 family)